MLSIDDSSLTRRLPFVAAGLSALVVLPFLGGHPIVNADDALYSGLGRRMAEDGLTLLPRFHRVPFIDKPPALLWLLALSYRAFGWGPLASHLPSALAATLLVALSVEIARAAGLGLRGRVLAALLLGGSVWHLHYARRALADLPMAATLALALLLLVRVRREHAPLLGGAVLGLAGLWKGVALAPFVPAAILVVAHRAGALRPALRDAAVLGGTAVLVVLPWHVVAAWREPREFLETYLAFQVLAKLGEDVDGAGQPAGFYLREAWRADPISLLWWIILPLLAAVPVMRDGGASGDREGPATRRALLLWGALTVTIFSLARVKHTSYVLPSLLPAAVLSAWMWERHARSRAVTLGTLLGASGLAALHVGEVVILGLYWESDLMVLGPRNALSPDLARLADAAPPPAPILCLDTYPMATWAQANRDVQWIVTSRRVYDAVEPNPLLGRSGLAVHVPPDELPAWLARRPGAWLIHPQGVLVPGGGCTKVQEGPDFVLCRLPGG
jgi:4-amino-4-deoxy-L-arabinose transferase-like glycosyltransferase